MDSYDQRYFEIKSRYKPRNIKELPKESQENINYFSSQIQSTAKDALTGQIFQDHAKKEISDLIEIINEIKRGDKLK